MMFGPHTAKLLRAAVGTGIDARASRDAGSYLCNYLSWRADRSRRDATMVRASPPSSTSRCSRATALRGARAQRIASRWKNWSMPAKPCCWRLVKLTRQAVREVASSEASIALRAERVNPTPNNRPLPPSAPRLRGRIFALLQRLRTRARASAGDRNHGRQSPPSHRSIRRRRGRRARDVARRRARGAARPRRSGATPRNMASGPAAPTIRPKSCSARSTTPRARRCRWRCRRASIAPSMLRLQNGTQLIGVRGATRLVFNGGASMFQGEGAGSIGLSNITLDGGGIPLPTRRGLIHCLGGRDIRIIDCEITGSGGNGIWFEQVSGDVSGNIITNTAATAIVSFDAQGLIVSRNTHFGHQRQRHRDPAHRDRRRRHAGRRQPHRGHQGRPRRLRTIRQRHQRVSRRQRDRARQSHPQLRLFRGARQFGLQHPDHRQQRQRRPRGGAVFGVFVRGRRDRQQHRGRRGGRRLRLQFQRGRTPRGRAGQHHPQPVAEAPDRHRAGRRRRHRHLCRGRHLGDRAM